MPAGVWVGDAGIASGRRHQNLVPAGPKVDLPLAKAEPNSKSSSTSIIIYIRKGEKMAAQQLRDRSEKM